MNKSWNGFHRTGTTIRRVAIYSLLLNLSLAAAKLVLSIITGSIALRADAIHSMVDVFGSLALIAGLIISSRKSSRFPYGLYKVENMVAIVISLLLFLTAYEIVKQALTNTQLINPYGEWVLILVSLMIPIPILFGRFEIMRGRMANSPSLIADGSQFRADALTASVVLFALLGQRFGIPLDRIAAIVIAIFIIRSGWDILVNGMRVLLDASVDVQTLDRIKHAIESDPTVSALKEVTARNSGRYLFVEATIILKVDDLERAHQASQHIEEKIKRTVPNVDRVLIHYEPRSKIHLRYAVALANSQREISQHFLNSPYFALIDIDLAQKSLVRQELVTNPYNDLIAGKSLRLGLKLAEFLLGYKPDVLVIKEDLSGKCPGYVFAEAGVETEQTEANSLDELVDTLLAGSEEMP